MCGWTITGGQSLFNYLIKIWDNFVMISDYDRLSCATQKTQLLSYIVSQRGARLTQITTKLWDDALESGSFMHLTQAHTFWKCHPQNLVLPLNMLVALWSRYYWLTYQMKWFLFYNMCVNKGVTLTINDKISLVVKSFIFSRWSQVSNNSQCISYHLLDSTFIISW